MSQGLLILIAEAVVVYFLVLWTHSLRHRVGLPVFYGFLGALTAVMSWVTDAGMVIPVSGIHFMVGSTVFYTSLLLGVFVVYVFDGPSATRVAIAVIAGVSVFMPLVAAFLHVQVSATGGAMAANVPVPSLRINAASVLTTVADFVFLAIAWEFLGKPRLHLPLWARSFATLLGVMWLDVLLFATGAFAGTDAYFSIMKGTFLSRLFISVFAFPFLYGYIHWQSRKGGGGLVERPVLAILREIAEVRAELGLAREEIRRRKAAEEEKQALIERLRETLAHVRHLEGLLPVCSGCHRIRVEPSEEDASEQAEQWVTLQEYIRAKTEVQFSHGLCPRCVKELYPDLASDSTSPA